VPVRAAAACARFPRQPAAWHAVYQFAMASRRLPPCPYAFGTRQITPRSSRVLPVGILDCILLLPAERVDEGLDLVRLVGIEPVPDI
jgi:hypothetical protein